MPNNKNWFYILSMESMQRAVIHCGTGRTQKHTYRIAIQRIVGLAHLVGAKYIHYHKTLKTYSGNAVSHTKRTMQKFRTETKKILTSLYKR